MTTAAAVREPLDPESSEGARAEQQLNQVLASVMTRLDRESREAALISPPVEPSTRSAGGDMPRRSSA